MLGKGCVGFVQRRQSKKLKVAGCLSLYFLGTLLVGMGIENNANAQEFRDIMIGSSLTENFDMGVNSGRDRTDWLSEAGGIFEASYPSGQSWGAVFVTVGPPTDPPRPSADFSGYDALSIDMRGLNGGEVVWIGIKTKDQRDNGRETKIRTVLTDDWFSYEYDLEAFRGANPAILYVVLEIVFDGQGAQTMHFRNIRYLRR